MILVLIPCTIIFVIKYTNILPRFVCMATHASFTMTLSKARPIVLLLHEVAWSYILSGTVGGVHIINNQLHVCILNRCGPCTWNISLVAFWDYIMATH